MPAKAKRTTHRSSKGTKLYAVRTSGGKFSDIQTFKKAHGADVKRTSKAEVPARAATMAKSSMASKSVMAKPAMTKPAPAMKVKAKTKS